jgi:LmbE family N-acetylglucosaminyl deacetylase
MRRLVTAALFAAVIALGAAAGVPAPDNAYQPPSAGGLAALDAQLARLTTNRRLLIIGAHPDDENTNLLTLVARRMGGEAAYLSLSRGEGGQNLIGAELGVGLGLIRTQELLAARRLDGGRQFFTRAYDFGFTRSADETTRRWPREILLEDAARVVRRFRPQVVYSVFSGTDRDGHGQHQAAGQVAREVGKAAGDPSGFPALAAEGLPPWKITSLFRSNWGAREGSILLSTGDVDPISGRSYSQIASASRSLHRSQDMGMLQPPGPAETGALWVEGGEGPQTSDLFAGVDTRLSSIAAGVRDADRRARAAALLDRAAGRAEQARRVASPADLPATLPAVASVLEDLRAARALVSESDEAAADLLDEKIEIAQEALADAALVTLDAVSDREAAAAGEALEATVSVWNAGAAGVEVVSVAIASPDGWRAEGPGAGRAVGAGKLETWVWKAAAPSRPTVPYFLERPLAGDLYDWSEVESAVRGEPFQPPALSAAVTMRVAGSEIRLRREVVYRFRDQAIGEIRRPVRAVPAVEITIDPDMIPWPASSRSPRRVEVGIVSNSDRPIEATLRVEVPAGWPAPDPVPLSLAKRGDRRDAEILLRPPAAVPSGSFPISIRARASDGSVFGSAVTVIDYPHIPATPMPVVSDARVHTFDLKLPPPRPIGYIRGASDRVPEFLRAVGLPVELLEGRALERGDLSRFGVIVVGVRAYETSPALLRANSRLRDWIERGGTLIVQYQQYDFVAGSGYAPRKLEIARPHDRVTDEAAPVTVLEPDHPVFSTPNRIGPEDWKGWVQERGLYFARSWDPAYRALLATADPGGPEQKGVLLVAPVGKGTFVYTGLAFFRQLPAGVPGAYRLFANLLALGGQSPVGRVVPPNRQKT